MKNRKSIPLRPLLTRYLVLPCLVLWLLSMGLLTWAVGNDFSRQLEVGVERWNQYASEKIEEGPLGYTEYKMLDRIMMGAYYLRTEPLLPIVMPQTPSSYGSEDWFWGKWDYVYGYQAAFGFYDHQGKPLFTSGGKYLVFPYLKNPEDRLQSYAYIDFSSLPDGEEAADRLISTFPGGDRTPLWSRMRFEGSLTGTQFFPAKLVSEYGVVYYENPEQIIDTALYVDDSTGYNYDPGPGFLYQGSYYESPAQLLDKQDIEASHNFFSTVITAIGSNTEFVTRAVVHCSPFLYALQRLWPVYLISGLLLTVCLMLLRRRLKELLWEPFAVINRAFEKDRRELSDFADSPIWELQELAQHFATAQQERHTLRQQVAQSQTEDASPK